MNVRVPILLLGAALLLTAAPASADPESDASVVMSAPLAVQAGQEIEYTITVASSGGPAEDVKLEDKVPTGTTAVSAAANGPNADCNQVGPSTKVFKCDLDTIPDGASVTVVLVVVTSAATPSPVQNVVEIEAEDDAVAANNSAPATTVVEPPPASPPAPPPPASPPPASPPPAPPQGADLVLVKSDSPDPVTVGGKLTYTLTVKNTGPAAATKVAVLDDPPASTKTLSATSTQGSCGVSGLVVCALGTMANGGVATVTIVVEPTKNGSIVNGATVFADEPFDPTTGNNTAFATTTSAPPATAAATPPATRDVVPPGKVESVRATVGNRSVVVTWRVPSDADFERVELTRSSARAARRVVYRGRAQQFTDRRLRNGVRYAYELRSFDRAGNASAGVRFAATPRALPLFSPPPNARLSTAPLLRWTAVRGASFYNVQLYHGSRKVLTVWPRTNRLRLRAFWTFRGRVERLFPGTYHWFVWPGRGSPARPRYGPLLGRNSFVFVPPTS
jgi:uncharacterized repeat protein (TIGR01451 family)